jgi:hypothetical protein
MVSTVVPSAVESSQIRAVRVRRSRRPVLIVSFSVPGNPGMVLAGSQMRSIS